MTLPRPEEPNDNIPRPPRPDIPSGAGEAMRPEPVHPAHDQAGSTADLAPPGDTPPPRAQRAAPNIGAASLRGSTEQDAAANEPAESPDAPHPASPSPANPEATEPTGIREGDGPIDPPTHPPRAEYDIPEEPPFALEKFDGYKPGRREAQAAAEICDTTIATLQARHRDYAHDTVSGVNAVQLIVPLPNRYMAVKVANERMALKDVYYTQPNMDGPEDYRNITFSYDYLATTDADGQQIFSRLTEDVSPDIATAPTSPPEENGFTTLVGTEEATMLSDLERLAVPAQFSVEDVQDAYFQRMQHGPATDIAAQTAGLDLAKDVEALFRQQSATYHPDSGHEQRIETRCTEDIGYLPEQSTGDRARVVVIAGTEHPANQGPFLPEDPTSNESYLLLGDTDQAAESGVLSPFIHVRSTRPASIEEDLGDREYLEGLNPGIPSNLPMHVVSESIVRVSLGRATLQMAISSFLGPYRCGSAVEQPIAIDGDDLALMMHLAAQPRYGSHIHALQHEFRQKNQHGHQ